MNYMGFGSGIVVDGTGISLQNRGADFSLDPEAVNCLQPGKRDFDLNTQQALDAPRWQWMRDGSVTVEKEFDDNTDSNIACY